MTLKKWRPFWSYDVEKTERWLAENAKDGKQLTDVNLLTRMFSFEKAECEKVEYQIVYDKSKSALPRGLLGAGWENALIEGNWNFIKNREDLISVYPVREGILKRNRLQSNVLTGIAFVYGMQFLFIALLLFIIVTSGGSRVEFNSFWIGQFFYFLQVVVVIWLAIHSMRKLRVFERKYFNSGVNMRESAEKTLSKLKFGWMSSPDLVQDWLAEMAAKGYHLVQVRGIRFIFEKGEPRLVSYEYDFQMKASLNYYDIHKSAGWQLKFTSPYAITKSSLWMKEYETGEEKPRFTYNSVEEKSLVRKVVTMNTGAFILSVLLTLYMFWVYNSINEDGDWIFGKVIVILMVLSLALPLSTMIRSLLYARRARELI